MVCPVELVAGLGGLGLGLAMPSIINLLTTKDAPIVSSPEVEPSIGFIELGEPDED